MRSASMALVSVSDTVAVPARVASGSEANVEVPTAGDKAASEPVEASSSVLWRMISTTVLVVERTSRPLTRANSRQRRRSPSSFTPSRKAAYTSTWITRMTEYFEK